MRKRNTKICYQTSLKGSSFLQEENRYLFEEAHAARTDSPSSERIEGLCVVCVDKGWRSYAIGGKVVI